MAGQINSDYMLSSYIDDFGNEYKNLYFKFKALEGFRVDNNTNPVFLRSLNKKNNCSQSNFFEPRKLIITMSDGNQVSVPIANPSLTIEVAKFFNSEYEPSCIELKGEEWTNIPPGVLGSNNYNSDPIEGITRPDNRRIKYAYVTTDFVITELRESIPILPIDIYQSILDCKTGVEDAKNSALGCVLNSLIKPRHFNGKRLLTESSIGKTLSRKIVVSNNLPANIKNCGDTLKAYYNCLGYKGESVKDMILYYGE